MSDHEIEGMGRHEVEPDTSMSPKELAEFAALSFRSDTPEDGIVWLTEMVAQYTDSRTADVLAAVASEDYEKAAELLEFTAATAF